MRMTRIAVNITAAADDDALDQGKKKKIERADTAVVVEGTAVGAVPQENPLDTGIITPITTTIGVIESANMIIARAIIVIETITTEETSLVAEKSSIVIHILMLPNEKRRLPKKQGMDCKENRLAVVSASHLETWDQLKTCFAKSDSRWRKSVVVQRTEPDLGAP